MQNCRLVSGKTERSLGVTEQTISKLLKYTGIIEMQRNWTAFELKLKHVKGVCWFVNSRLKGNE